MDELTYRINAIESSMIKLITLFENFSAKKETESSELKQKYFSLRDAVALKYGDSVSYQTVATNIYLQPCCGQAYFLSGGKRLWTQEQLEEYITIQDFEIPKYAAKYGVPLVGRLGEKYKKYEKEEEAI